MFGGSFWNTPIGDVDLLSKEREPPPRPTKLEFPDYVPAFKSSPLTRKLSLHLQHKICHSKSFLDISDEDVAALNVSFDKDVSVSSLLPKDQFASRPLLFDDELQAMLDEVSVDNEDAFREVLRMQPLPGRKKPKLAYARNFFGSLEDIARYFDDSQDQYYRVPIASNVKAQESASQPKEATSKEDSKAQEDTSVAAGTDEVTTREVYKGYRISSAESLSPGTRLAMLKNLLKTTMHRFQCRDHEPIPHPREKLTIRGVRIQSIQYHFCVARIPQDIKMARARHVEGPIMAVSPRDELRFKDKSGLESPDKRPFVGERFDFFREIGCMLILATQRARTKDSKPAKVEDKWWISKQRWGGGPTKWGQLAYEIYEDEDPSWSPEETKLQMDKSRKQEEDIARGIDPNKLEVTDLIANGGSDTTTKATTLPGISAGNSPNTPTDLDIRPRKKKLRSMERPPGDQAILKDGRRLMYVPPFKQKWYQEWTKLRPNTSLIDERIISKKVGAESEAFDEVWMLTSVNHHVALLKMRVHPDYLQWLDSGDEVPEEELDGLKKNVLYVSRTKWFDMLDVESRKEFLVGLWRVFCWINRDYVLKDEYKKMEEKRANIP